MGNERSTGAPLFRLRLPDETDPTRLRVRRWLADHPAPSGEAMLDAGLVVPHWPAPWGHEAAWREVVVIAEEMQRAGVEQPVLPLVRGYVGPLLLTSGSAEQQARFLRPMLTGEQVWCQLFSEPEAGSDLAGLTTRALRDGNDYVAEGVKTWTTHGHLSQYGVLLARTDPGAAKHRGLSLFVCPMDAAGLTMRPVHDMDGQHKWNMVYLDRVRLPRELLVGAENDGWRVARGVLANERMSMSGGEGLAWGQGPTYADLLPVAHSRAAGSPLDDGLRQRLATGYAQALALHVMRTRSLGRISHEEHQDVVPEVRRTLADDHGQAMLELWRDLFGPAGTLRRPDPEPTGDPFADHYLFARALTIGGGTGEVQRNVLGERVLGLPRA